MAVRRDPPADDADDAAAFRALFEAHSADLMRYAIRRVGPDTARDVVADVFLTAWRRRGSYRADIARLWLFKVAHNVIANERRRGRREDRLDQKLRASARAEQQLVRWADPGDTAVELLQVRHVLAGLPWRDQEALRLVEWERLSPADAATVAGCSQAAFRVRLHRARRRFSKALSEDDELGTSGAAGTTSASEPHRKEASR